MMQVTVLSLIAIWLAALLLKRIGIHANPGLYKGARSALLMMLILGLVINLAYYLVTSM